MTSVDRVRHTFASRLKQERIRRGWSQGGLADRLGVAQSLVSTWEAGRRDPGLDQLRRLAAVLDRPILHLIEGQAHLDDAHLLAELRWYGLDVHGSEDPVWAVRAPEEVFAAALRAPRPRVVDRLPALFFLQPAVRPRLLRAHADIHGVGRRLGWVHNVALALVRLGVGQPTAALLDLDLDGLLPPADAAWDALDHPADAPERLPRAWRRWRISYDRDVAAFAEIARGLLDAR